MVLSLESAGAAAALLLLVVLGESRSPAGPDWRAPPEAPPGPGAPLGFRADREGTVVSITWIGPADPEVLGYDVYRRCGATDWFRVNPTLLLERRFVDETRVQGFEYEYRVEAVDASGRSSLSAAFAVEEGRP